MAPQIDGGCWAITIAQVVQGYVWVPTVGSEYFLVNPGITYPFKDPTCFAKNSKTFASKAAFKAWALDKNGGDLDANAVETFASVTYNSPW